MQHNAILNAWLKRIKFYDPATNQWTNACPMNIARSVAGVASLGSSIYVTGAAMEKITLIRLRAWYWAKQLASLPIDECEEICTGSGGIRVGVCTPVEVSVDCFRPQLRNWYQEWNCGRTVCQWHWGKYTTQYHVILSCFYSGVLWIHSCI